MWKQERDGKIRYFERYKDPRSGRQKTVSVTLEKKADKKAAKMLQDLIHDATLTVGDYTLSEVIRLYLTDQERTVATATYKRNRSAMTAIEALLGGYNKIDKLTAGYIRERLLASGKPARTCNGYIKRLVGFMRWAYQNDLILSTACVDKLKRFKDTPIRERIQDKFLNRVELSALLEQMPDEGYRLITEFLALSGLRIGELIALEDKDVTDVISVTKSYSIVANEITPGKTFSSRRTVHIQPELASCVKRLRAFMLRRKLLTGSKESYFCINRKGHRFQYAAYCKNFKTYTKKLIGRELTPHSLRHTHASLLMEAGYPLDAISRRLGHENSDITKEIYLHVTDGIRKHDADLIDGIELLPFCYHENEKTSGSP